MFDTLIFSDLHAHTWGEFSSVGEYRGQTLNTRLIDAARVIDRVRHLVIKSGYRRVIFGGDLFHRKRLIDVPVFNTIAGAMWRLASVVDKLFILAGNHDLSRRSAEGSFSDEHALFALSGHPKVKIVDRPFTYDGMGFLPYAADRETFMRGLADVASCKSIVMHAGIQGARTGPIEYLPLEPVDVSDLPNTTIFSGHYHGPQTVGPVIYIGAPIEHVRGDDVYRDGPRGFIACDWASSRFRRIGYKRAPRFLRVDMAEVDDAVAGHFVDVRVASSMEVPKALVRCVEAGARAVVPVVAVEKQVVMDRLGITTTGGTIPSIATLCERYVAASGSGVDAAALLRYAQTALNEAEAPSRA